jgi:uncharacterized membrane protein
MNGRITKIALAASIALNVFILGAAAGAFFWRSWPTPPQRVEQGLAAVAQALEPAQRQAFRQALATARRDAEPDSQAARAAREELARLLGEPNLDRATIDATLDATRAADIRVRARTEAAVVDFAENLDPQDRAKLVQGLSSRGQMLIRDAKK